MKLKDIIVVNDFGHIEGGASQVAISSASALSQEGYSVKYFCAKLPISSELIGQANLHIEYTDQVDIKNDPIRLRSIYQGIWNRKAQVKFRELLTSLDKNNTIIHLHGWTKALSSSVIREALNRKFKVVCTIHDYFLVCPNGAFYNYKKDRICTLKPLSQECLATDCDARSYQQKLWRFIRSTVQNHVGYLPNGVKYYISVSDLSASIIRQYLPENASIFPLSNPIDVPKIDPIDVTKNRAFFMAGRIAKEKGVLRFARAIEAIGAQAIIIGDGPYRLEVEKINPSITVLGWLSHDEVINHLKSARALIAPSLLYETFGLSVLEAAAIGIPAIVADNSAGRELVTDRVTGLWFRGDSDEDLVHKIRILQDSQLSKQMGLEAYKTYWSSPRDLNTHVSQLIDIYSSILS